MIYILLQNRYQRSPSGPSLYVKSEGIQNLLIVYLYVDDLIHTNINQKIMKEFKNNKIKEYEMTDLSLMKYFLGI